MKSQNATQTAPKLKLRPTRRHALVLLAGATAIPSVAAANSPANYVLDGGLPQVGFTYKLDGTKLTAAMPVAYADVQINGEAPQRSTIDVALDAANARLGLNFVDTALSRPDMLHTSNHPTIRFTATNIGQINEGTALVEGKLTMRGVTRPLTMTARVEKAPSVPGRASDRATIHMTGAISRADFGATGYPGLVSDRIELAVTSHLRAV